MTAKGWMELDGPQGGLKRARPSCDDDEEEELAEGEEEDLFVLAADPDATTYTPGPVNIVTGADVSRTASMMTHVFESGGGVKWNETLDSATRAIDMFEGHKTKIRTTEERSGKRSGVLVHRTIVCQKYQRTCPFKVILRYYSSKEIIICFPLSCLDHHHNDEKEGIAVSEALLLPPLPPVRSKKTKATQQQQLPPPTPRQEEPGQPLPGAELLRRMHPEMVQSAATSLIEDVDPFWNKYQTKVVHAAIVVDRDKAPRKREVKDGQIPSAAATNVLYETEYVATAEEFIQLLRPEDREYCGWWIANFSSSNKGDLAYMAVLGVNAIDLQRSLNYLHRIHYVFGFQTGTETWRKHAIFSRGTKKCFLAIERHCLRAARMHMIRHIPLDNKMPSAPVLVQAWALASPTNHEMRRHGMAAVLFFLAQHLDAQKRGSGATHLAGMHPLSSPAFAIYDHLPEFIDMIRSNADLILLVRIRESMPQTAEYLPGHWMDSAYSLVNAFVMQRRQHRLYKDMVDLLWSVFQASPIARHRYPVAMAILRYFKAMGWTQRGPGRPDWISMYIPSWDALKLPESIPRPSDDLLPHHFLYELCFSGAADVFPLSTRYLLASRIILDVHVDGASRPAFNLAEKRLLTDDYYSLELREYVPELVKSLPSVEETSSYLPAEMVQVTIREDELEEDDSGDEDDDREAYFHDLFIRGGGGGGESSSNTATEKPWLIPYSDSTGDLWKLGPLFLFLKTVQHICWNPKVQQTATDCARNLITLLRQENVCPQSAEWQYLEVLTTGLDDLRGPIRIPDPAVFAIEHSNMPIGCIPEKSQDNPVVGGHKFKIFYMEHFLVAWPCTQLLKAGPISQLEATTLIRNPSFYGFVPAAVAATTTTAGTKRRQLRK